MFYSTAIPKYSVGDAIEWTVSADKTNRMMFIAQNLYAVTLDILPSDNCLTTNQTVGVWQCQFLKLRATTQNAINIISHINVYRL